jgi:uncharacterized membrane protein required for colicin V production
MKGMVVEMSIIIDIILIAIVAISAILGYKKGLVELGAKLFAGIIAIILTLIIYKPVANMVMSNTGIDEKIETIIIQKTNEIVDDNTPTSDNKYIQDATEGVANQIKNEISKEQAQSISKNVIYAVSIIIIFIAVKIILTIIIKLLGVVAELPILKQFNELGGLVYGLIRGIFIIVICTVAIGIFINCNPENDLNQQIQETFITKAVYNSIVKNW